MFVVLDRRHCQQFPYTRLDGGHLTDVFLRAARNISTEADNFNSLLAAFCAHTDSDRWEPALLAQVAEEIRAPLSAAAELQSLLQMLDGQPKDGAMIFSHGGTVLAAAARLAMPQCWQLRRSDGKEVGTRHAAAINAGAWLGEHVISGAVFVRSDGGGVHAILPRGGDRPLVYQVPSQGIDNMLHGKARASGRHCGIDTSRRTSSTLSGSSPDHSISSDSRRATPTNGSRRASIPEGCPDFSVDESTRTRSNSSGSWARASCGVSSRPPRSANTFTGHSSGSSTPRSDRSGRQLSLCQNASIMNAQRLPAKDAFARKKDPRPVSAEEMERRDDQRFDDDVVEETPCPRENIVAGRESPSVQAQSQLPVETRNIWDSSVLYGQLHAKLEQAALQGETIESLPM